MVLVIIVGDLHFKKDNAMMSDLVILKIMEKIKETKPDFVVLLGDILDGHERIHGPTQNKASRFIRHIAAICPVIIIVGNHDRPDPSTYLTEESCFFQMKGISNIHIADRVLSFKYKTEGSADQIRFVFVPYVPPGTFHDALDTLEEKVMDDDKPQNRPAAIFCHQEFKGATMRGRKSSNGDEWAKDNPLIISGHLHKFQQPQTNIVYAGTPYQTSFLDDSQKGILIAEFSPDKAPSINFLELNIRKKKIIKLKVNEVDAFIPPENCDVKIVIEGEMDEIKDIQSSGFLTKMIGRGIHVSLNPKTSVNPRNPHNKSYKDLLLEMIGPDKEAIEMFNSIFGTSESRKIEVTSNSQNLSTLLNTVKGIIPTNVTEHGADLIQTILSGSVVRGGISPSSVVKVKSITDATKENIQSVMSQTLPNQSPHDAVLSNSIIRGNNPTPIVQALNSPVIQTISNNSNESHETTLDTEISPIQTNTIASLLQSAKRENIEKSSMALLNSLLDGKSN